MVPFFKGEVADALHRVMDSRLRGNDGMFCKGLHQGRGGLCRLCCLVVSPASLHLWIADQVRDDGPGSCGSEILDYSLCSE